MKIAAPRVFWPSVLLIAFFVILAVALPGPVGAAVSAAQDVVVGTFNWYYVLIVCGFVAFAVRMGMGRFGDIRLAPDGDEQPRFALCAWFAMLFAAGMGIGLVFWGAAEPLNHFADPKPGVGGAETEIAQQSLVQTFLHWGLHPWAVYVVVALAMAYAIHRKNRPVSVRWALEPLLGNRVRGRLGDLIDVIAIIGTVFGVATSLGLGVLQVASGLDLLGLVDAPGPWTHVLLVGGISALALASVVSGLDRGIKWLSQANVGLAALLLVIVLVAGPTLFLLREFVQSAGLYLQNLLQLSLDTTAMEGQEGARWHALWTTFYWGWWIAWAPFVGVFIARISRGRTVREFVTGVLLVPTAVTFLWLTVFGGSALIRELVGPGGGVAADGSVDTEGALFGLLSDLPAGGFLVAGSLVLIVLFFVTSSDSGSLVVCMLASGGEAEPARWTRVFWASAQGLVAIALLLAGGLSAFQVASVLFALPFSVVMLAMCVATWKAFAREARRAERLQREGFTEKVVEKATEKVTEDFSRCLADGGPAPRRRREPLLPREYKALFTPRTDQGGADGSVPGADQTATDGPSPRSRG